MNVAAYIMQIWLPLVVWQQVDAPRYFKGYVTVSSMSVMLIVMCFIVRHLYNRELFTKSFAQQENATESCVQKQQRSIDGSMDSSSTVHLGQFRSKESIEKYDCEEISPSSSNNMSPCDEEKALPSNNSMHQSPVDPVDLREASEMEVCRSRNRSID